MVDSSDRSVPSQWSPQAATDLSPLQLLVYASNLLGSDKRITNFGGGNTSQKVRSADPITGEPRDVMYVKGSGGDLGTATEASFAALDLARVLCLEDLAKAKALHEDDVVPLYEQCAFGSNRVACSIDTPLHAFVPAAAVSHMHADSVIALAASRDAQRLMTDAFGDRLGFLPWKRPGFDLGLQLRNLITSQPGIQGALMESHGFICWAEEWQACYELTLEIINQAQTYLDGRGKHQPFGQVNRRDAEDSRESWSQLLPQLRGGTASDGIGQIATIDESEEVQNFLASEAAPRLAALGTSCPDHFLRTKIAPLWLDRSLPLGGQIQAYKEAYAAYYERNRQPNSPPMRNPSPSVVLVPGLGMVSFGRSAKESRVTGEFYRNAIRVMRGAEAVSEYVALPEAEAFGIEYWQLEEAKLQRMPPPKPLSRRIAVVTGGAQGIGRATAARLAEMGACVAVLDRDLQRLEDCRQDLSARFGADSVLAVPTDVTDQSALREAFSEVVLSFGGLDIAVINAGTARRGTVSVTDEPTYDALSEILMKAYFFSAQVAVNVMKNQGLGGSIVFVASKNGVAVGANAAAYSAAKAFELHLMRTVAVDHAVDGIRANAVNPDGVVTGSGIWSEAWRSETAALLGIEPGQVSDYYRDRSLLKVAVEPDDVAKAIAWLADSAQSSRTTGCVITVDGGNREGFLR